MLAESEMDEDQEWYCKRINVVNKRRDPNMKGWFVPKPPLDDGGFYPVINETSGELYRYLFEEHETMEDDAEIDENKWINDENDVELRSPGKANLDAAWRKVKIESGLLDLFEELMQHKAYRYHYAWDSLDSDALKAIMNANRTLLGELFGLARYRMALDIQWIADLVLRRREWDMRAAELDEDNLLKTAPDSAKTSSELDHGIHHSDCD